MEALPKTERDDFMKKLLLTIIAGAVLVISTPAAFAAVGATVPPTKPGCQINCVPGGDGPDGDPGEPFIPGEPVDEDCMFNCGDTSTIPDPDKPEDGTEPGDPGLPGGTVNYAEIDGCGEKLGSLRDVTVEQIQQVAPTDVVDIIQVCRAKTLGNEQESVAGLRPEIDANDKLHGELRGDGFNANDVVGVIVNGKAVTLYVHRS